MKADAVTSSDEGPGRREPSLVDLVHQWKDSGLDLVSGVVDLAAIEARLAGASLASMLAAAIALAVLLASAWLGLCASLFLWIFDAPGYFSITAMAVGGLSLAAGAVCWLVIRLSSRNLEFRETREALFTEHAQAHKSSSADDDAQHRQSRVED